MIYLHEIREAVASCLIDDADLLAMLANNAPWNDPKGALSKVNSIVPMSEISKMTPMYIGVMAGPSTVQELNAYETFMYIRAYNSMDKTYYDIDRALSQIAKNLNGARFTMPNTALAESHFEDVSIDSIDDAVNQRYREARFRLVVI